MAASLTATFESLRPTPVDRSRFSPVRSVESEPHQPTIASMNNVRSLVKAARASGNPGASLYSDQMLAELLALNEEMVEQLRLERLGKSGDSALLSGMIEQHEKAAAMLRLQLAQHQSGAGRNGATALPAKPGKRVRGSAGRRKPAADDVINGANGPH